MEEKLTVWTIGHSTRPIDEFARLLKAHGVRLLADVRTIPKSARHPQFNQQALQEALSGQGIRYVHMKGLGGLRKPRPDSRNTGWRVQGFRGYADYMETAEFEKNLKQLLRLARKTPTAFCCAEAVPWKCHRSLLSDALTVRGAEVRHILSEGPAQEHRLTPFAQVEGDRIRYATEAAPS